MCHPQPPLLQDTRQMLSVLGLALAQLVGLAHAHAPRCSAPGAELALS
jgi:hypothetical protein